jgi:hypothetical protein
MLYNFRGAITARIAAVPVIGWRARRIKARHPRAANVPSRSSTSSRGRAIPHVSYYAARQRLIPYAEAGHLY